MPRSSIMRIANLGSGATGAATRPIVAATRAAA